MKMLSTPVAELTKSVLRPKCCAGQRAAVRGFAGGRLTEQGERQTAHPQGESRRFFRYHQDFTHRIDRRSSLSDLDFSGNSMIRRSV